MLANRDREVAEKEREKDTFMGGHLLQRMVDVGKIRVLFGVANVLVGQLPLRLESACRTHVNEGIQMGFPRVPWFLGDVLVTKKQYERLCKVREQATFVAQCGSWHRMESKINVVRNVKKAHDKKK